MLILLDSDPWRITHFICQHIKILHLSILVSLSLPSYTTHTLIFSSTENLHSGPLSRLLPLLNIHAARPTCSGLFDHVQFLLFQSLQQQIKILELEIVYLKKQIGTVYTARVFINPCPISWFYVQCAVLTRNLKQPFYIGAKHANHIIAGNGSR